MEITIEDPIMYTRPWKVTEITPLLNGGDLIEYVCTENERDSRHLDAIDAQIKSRRPKPSSWRSTRCYGSNWTRKEEPSSPPR